MNIKKFKMNGGINTVEFESGDNVIKIATPDRAEKELLKAMTAFVSAALGYFGSVSAASFYSVSISGSDDPTSQLEVDIPTKHLGDNARVKFPAVSRSAAYDKNGDVNIEHPRNIYNAALEAFVEHIARFASGNRLQAELPFDDEAGIASDKITLFSREAL